MTSDPENRVFNFNGDNKQSKVFKNGNIASEYFYDGEGKRVKKKVYDAANSNIVTEETVFVYSSGKLIAEYSTAPLPTNPTTSYTATDQLGSPRVITNALGQVTSRRDFMPFGEQAPNDGIYRPTNLYPVGDGIRQKFTGYQKDEETQLDFAEARMYENRHGRFTAVDPLLASGKSADPQTFNRYVYVLNNPLIMTDPTGLQTGTPSERVGRWYTSDTPDSGRKYIHPRFLRPDENTPNNYRPMSKEDHVYYNLQRAKGGEKNVWTVSNPYRMEQENYETRDQAVARLYELEPSWDPNPPAVDNAGYYNFFAGYAFPQAAGFGVAGGMIYDRETQQLMTQTGIIWSTPGPVFNATYSPFGASDGLTGTAGYGLGFGRVAASGGVNQNGEPSVEVGASSPGPLVGVFFVYRPQRTPYFENSNSSEQSLESMRKRLGFVKPPNVCFSVRCNSNTNTNNTQP